MIIMSTKAQEHWDQVIADLETRLEKARAIRAVLGDDVLADELAKIFTFHTPHFVTLGGKRIQVKQVPQTIFRQVAQFFADRENQWATIEEIVQGTDMKRDSVRGLIYKGNVDAFEKRRHPNPPGGPGSARLGQFKLTEDVFDETVARAK